MRLIKQEKLSIIFILKQLCKRLTSFKLDLYSKNRKYEIVYSHNKFILFIPPFILYKSFEYRSMYFT